MKYCIGCVHLNFIKPRRAAGSECTGSWTIESAQLACAKGYWRQFITDYAPVGGADLEKAMQLADICADFQERPAP